MKLLSPKVFSIIDCTFSVISVFWLKIPRASEWRVIKGIVLTDHTHSKIKLGCIQSLEHV